jgi:hypothetical protein
LSRANASREGLGHVCEIVHCRNPFRSLSIAVLPGTASADGGSAFVGGRFGGRFGGAIGSAISNARRLARRRRN